MARFTGDITTYPRGTDREHPLAQNMQMRNMSPDFVLTMLTGAVLKGDSIITVENATGTMILMPDP